MGPRNNRLIPRRIGIFVFLLLSVAVVSTQAQTAVDRVQIMESQPLASGPLVLRATDFAVRLVKSRRATSAEH